MLKRVKRGLPSAPRAEPGVPSLCPQRSPAPSATAAPKPGPPQEVSGGRSGGTGGVGGCPPLTPPGICVPPRCSSCPRCSTSSPPPCPTWRGGTAPTPPAPCECPPDHPRGPSGGSPGLTDAPPPVMCFPPAVARARSLSPRRRCSGRTRGATSRGPGGLRCSPAPPRRPRPRPARRPPPPAPPCPCTWRGDRYWEAPPPLLKAAPGPPAEAPTSSRGGTWGGAARPMLTPPAPPPPR